MLDVENAIKPVRRLVTKLRRPYTGARLGLKRYLKRMSNRKTPWASTLKMLERRGELCPLDFDVGYAPLVEIVVSPSIMRRVDGQIEKLHEPSDIAIMLKLMYCIRQKKELNLMTFWQRVPLLIQYQMLKPNFINPFLCVKR